MPAPSESRDHRSAQRRRETPSAPVSPRKGEDPGNHADQGARLIRGIGQKSVVRILARRSCWRLTHLSAVRGATDESSDESSHAPCDTDAYRYPQDVGLRFAARWIESRRGSVANGCAIRETVVSSRCLSGPVSA
jgi:hypothetical protein